MAAIAGVEVEVDAEAVSTVGGQGALVNLALTVTEVKTLVLGAAGLACPEGGPASGTSTDAVVVAATGRGPAVRFGGPISEAGWVVARAVRTARGRGVRRRLEHAR